MTSVILIIHLVLALAIIGLVMVQRSEGGGLGIGGSGGLGGLATPQGTANILTRATGLCAAGFFATSLILGSLAGHTKSTSVLDQLDNTPAVSSTAPDMPSAGDPSDSSPASKSPAAPVESAPAKLPTAPVSE